MPAQLAAGWTRMGFPFCLGRLFQVVEPVDDWHRQNREVFWASGAALFVRKSAWVEAAGFGRRSVRTHGRNRLVLAASKHGPSHWVCGTGDGAALGRWHVAKFEPLQDLLELPQQPHCDGQEPRRFVACVPRMTLDGIAACRMLSQGQWRQFRLVRCRGSTARPIAQGADGGVLQVLRACPFRSAP